MNVLNTAHDELAASHQKAATSLERRVQEFAGLRTGKWTYESFLERARDGRGELRSRAATAELVFAQYKESPDRMTELNAINLEKISSDGAKETEVQGKDVAVSQFLAKKSELAK